MQVKTSIRWGLYLLLLAMLSACGNVKFSAPQGKVDANGNPITSGPPGSERDPFCDANGEQCDLPPVPVTQTAFSQSTNKVDILFVIDSSGSMDQERAALGSRLANFTAKLGSLDWQICVTTTDPAKEKGNLLPFSIPGAGQTNVLTAAIPNYNDIFLDRIVRTPSGSGDEQGIAALNLAISKRHADCIRNDAALATVILSDEDERSVGGYDQYKNDPQYVPLTDNNKPSTLLANIKSTYSDQKIYTGHALVIRSGDQACFDAQLKAGSRASFGTWYEQLAKSSGGGIGNICASDYAAEVQSFATAIVNSIDSITLKCAPVSTPTVTYSPARPGTTHSVKGDKITFSPALPAGTRVDLGYNCPGGTKP